MTRRFEDYYEYYADLFVIVVLGEDRKLLFNPGMTTEESGQAVKFELSTSTPPSKPE